ILLEGTPKQTVEAIQGKIWTTNINKEDLTVYKQKFNVISQYINQGKMTLHVFANEQPSAEFMATDADLEDVYFSNIIK
ncbi:MAG: ABC transporter ATP-binding protein, partial [Bacteroidetes bacterium]|nr:ABC transporter ATP-binding protein [Bacteroidota bacterium]